MKNGVLHGPYLYESYRDKDGKVKKRYLGRHIGMSREGFLLMCFLFLVMLFSFGMIVKVFLQSII
jgi:hypothetical protein